MEVTPEIFAWLTSLNIIDPFNSFSQDLVNDFQIPEKTVSLLLGGKYINILIKQLQEAYNKFYNIQEDYTSNLIKLKQIPENQEYVSNSIKYSNWKTIFEILSHFGLSFSEDELSLLVNNDKDQLKKVISKIYFVYSKFLNGKNNENNNTKIIELSNNNKLPLSSQNEIKTNSSNININDLDPLKYYEECNSILEFIILSLCKNLNMKPRQSVALLSKNRTYLKKICINGYNYDYQAIKKWLTDLYNNQKIMIKLISDSEDGLNICYATIGTALYCKQMEISLQSAQLLDIIKYKVRMNYDWLYNEGINAFILILNKEDNHIKKDFLKILYDFIKEDISLFFEELKKKFTKHNNKKVIYDLLSNIIIINDVFEKDFSFYFQNFVHDICLTKLIDSDISYNISMLTETFFKITPYEDNNFNKILAYLKDCIRGNIQSIYSTAIYQSFYLMENFGKIKNKYAPQLYKNIVFIFLEEYDNELKREIFLENFEKFFNENQNIPIDILFEPYLNQLLKCKNYGLSDFLFLLKMVEHPRIEMKDIFDIIQFVLNTCLNNITYARSANLILSLIFEKNLLFKKNNYLDSEIEFKFIEFINTALDLYISNVFNTSNTEDKFILETPYEIMTQNFENVNMRVKETLVNSVKNYRKIKGFHSSGLLAMMWYYNDNDDIMMQIEELNRPIYEPMSSYLERKKREQEERDRHDYTKKLIISLNQLREKKLNIALNRQVLNEQKKFKEDKIKKRLMERRRIIRLMSGIEARVRPPVLGINTKDRISRSNSDLYEQINNKNLLFRANKLQTGNLKSNMLYATGNAAQNYVNKGIINENSNFYQKINSETSSQNNFNVLRNIKRSNSELNIYDNNNEQNILKKYGMLLSEEKKKKNKIDEYEMNSINIKKKSKEMSKLLIQKEGTFIHPENLFKNKRYLMIKDLYIESLGMPFDLSEEEDREIKAIKGYNKEYRKNISFYFKAYANEAKQKISKSNLVRLLRDIGLDKEKINYEEISTLIRLMFKDNFSEFDFNQFINLLVQLSYIIYTKRRPCMTIGETYSILLKKFSIKKLKSEKIPILKKKYSKVIDYLLQLKEEKKQFNIPDGFIFVKKTYVKYNCRLAPHMEKYIGESRLICYQILEEIIYDSCKSSIIEPYVEVSNEEIVEIEPEKIHNWSPGLTMAFIDLDKSLKFHGMFAADILEDGINKIIKKNYEENNEGKLLKYAKGLFNIKWVKQDLKKKKEFRQNQIIIYERRKVDLESENNKYKPQVSREKYDEIKEKFKEVRTKIEKREEEKRQKRIENDKIKLENQLKKNQEMITVYKNRKRKLKEQFKAIIDKNKKISQERQEEEKKELEKYKRKEYILSDSERNYKDFEKNLNNSMKNLIEKEEIKSCLDQYMNHFKVIYDIYSKIGYNKISFNSKEVMHIDEFKQFLINFAILGVYITSDQMSWIFKTISKASQTERYNEMYFDFNDFIVSICYLTIFSKYENKTCKIMPKDIEEMGYDNVENFLKNLGLKLPFNKIELEKFINERRSMTMKNMLTLQHDKKREEAKNHNNNINSNNTKISHTIKNTEGNKSSINANKDNKSIKSNNNITNIEKKKEDNISSIKKDDNKNKNNINNEMKIQDKNSIKNDKGNIPETKKEEKKEEKKAEKKEEKKEEKKAEKKEEKKEEEEEEMEEEGEYEEEEEDVE